MKKYIAVLFFILCLSFGFTSPVYAGGLTFSDYPDVEVDATYTVTYENGKYIYKLYIEVLNCPFATGSAVYYGDFDILGNHTNFEYLTSMGSAKYVYDNDDEGKRIRTAGVLTYTSDKLLYDESGVVGIYLRCGLQLGSNDWTYYYVEFSSTDPVPDNCPESQPEITPDVEPEITPDPTPTNTPSSTPGIQPDIKLDVTLQGTTLTADCHTSGYSPVMSFIELYDFTDIEMLIEQERFDTEDFVRNDTIHPGKLYRYRLVYIFDYEGSRYVRYVWSDDLFIQDTEMDDYQQSGKIHNFRTLMTFIWDDLMELQLPVEGFQIKFKTIFIWSLIAGVIILFFKKVL